MAATMVEKATAEELVGADWAMNLEICDILNRDPGHSKDFIKAIKKRLGHKNSAVQMHTLILLETIIKNCSDIVHMQVAEKGVLHDMVKIAKKKPDYRVKDKILSLIDTWQEAFGGPNARHLQYYSAYQELLRAGAVFPQRSESSVPIFTPPQTQPLQNYPPAMRTFNRQPDVPSEPSTMPNVPTLSQSEMKAAREMIEVLSEMLNALDPGNREGLKEDVIVELVAQCRVFKQKFVQLVNSTQNEDLLSQGLALNDDLEQVLGKHDAIAAGIAFRKEAPRAPRAPAQIEKPAVTKSEKEQDQRSTASTSSSAQSPFELLALPPPPSSRRSSATIPTPSSSAKSSTPTVAAQSSTAPSAKVPSNFDLLSGDNYLKPEDPANALALVPMRNDSAPISASDQNVLAFADMFSQNNAGNHNSNIPNVPSATPAATLTKAPSSTHALPYAPSQQQQQVRQQQPSQLPQQPSQSQLPQQQYLSQLPQKQQQPQQPGVYNNGLSYGPPVNYATDMQQPAWNYAAPNDQGEDLPPPPWEIPTAEGSMPQGSQYGMTQSVRGMEPSPSQYGMLHGAFPQPTATPLPQPVPNTLYGQMYPSIQNVPTAGYYPPQMLSRQYSGITQQPMYGGQMLAYGYGPPGSAYYAPTTMYSYAGENEFSQSMNGLSLQSGNTYAGGNSSVEAPVSTSLGQSSNMSKPPEDALFGDLLNIARTKQTKPAGGRVGGS